jgi:hypothetical protein
MWSETRIPALARPSLSNKGSNVAFSRVDIRPIAVKGSMSDRELAQYLDKLSVTDTDMKSPERETALSPRSPSMHKPGPPPAHVDTSAVNFETSHIQKRCSRLCSNHFLLLRSLLFRWKMSK